MAAPVHLVVDEEGLTHTTCLHKGHFTRLLWETLQDFGYTEPPEYVGYEFVQLGLPRCEVHVDLPLTPAYPDWESWGVVAYGARFEDTWEVAAHKALTRFCKKHPAEIAAMPAGLFPLKDQGNPDWMARIWKLGDTTEHLPARTLKAVTHYAICMANLYTLQSAALDRTRDTAQDLDARVREKDVQIHELEVAFVEKMHVTDHLEEQLQEVQEHLQEVQDQAQDFQVQLQHQEAMVEFLEGELMEADQHIAEHHQWQPPIPEPAPPADEEEAQGESGVESGPGSPGLVGFSDAESSMGQAGSPFH